METGSSPTLVAWVWCRDRLLLLDPSLLHLPVLEGGEVDRRSMLACWHILSRNLVPCVDGGRSNDREAEDDHLKTEQPCVPKTLSIVQDLAFQ